MKLEGCPSPKPELANMSGRRGSPVYDSANDAAWGSISVVPTAPARRNSNATVKSHTTDGTLFTREDGTLILNGKDMTGKTDEEIAFEMQKAEYGGDVDAAQDQEQALAQFRAEKPDTVGASQTKKPGTVATADAEDYNRYKDILQLKGMEEDMFIQARNRYTKEELMRMDTATYDIQSAKVKSAHQKWWEDRCAEKALNQFAADERAKYGGKGAVNYRRQPNLNLTDADLYNSDPEEDFDFDGDENDATEVASDMEVVDTAEEIKEDAVEKIEADTTGNIEKNIKETKDDDDDVVVFRGIARYHY